jgi:hypothetical protein
VTAHVERALAGRGPEHRDACGFRQAVRQFEDARGFLCCRAFLRRSARVPGKRLGLQLEGV